MMILSGHIDMWQAEKISLEYKMEAADLYKRFLDQLDADMKKFKNQGFHFVQIFGGKGRYCSVCAPLINQIYPVTASAAEILLPHCENLKGEGYHCAPMVSPAIKDESGNVRFERFSDI